MVVLGLDQAGGAVTALATRALRDCGQWGAREGCGELGNDRVESASERAPSGSPWRASWRAETSDVDVAIVRAS